MKTCEKRGVIPKSSSKPQNWHDTPLQWNQLIISSAHLKLIEQINIPWVHVFHALVLVLVNPTAKYEAKSSKNNTSSSPPLPFLLKTYALTSRNRTRRHLDSSTTILTVPNTDPIIGTPSVRHLSLIQNPSDEKGKRWRGYVTPCLSKWKLQERKSQADNKGPLQRGDWCLHRLIFIKWGCARPPLACRLTSITYQIRLWFRKPPPS